MAKNEMTREEASKKLTALKESIEEYAGLNEEGQEMFRMAIKALEAEPCEDTISRQAAIDAIDTWDKFGCDGNGKLVRIESEESLLVPYVHYDDVIKAVNNLPPVTPAVRTGHWIPHETPDGGVQYECSRCGVLWEFNDGTPEDNEAYFCPKCGSYNRGKRK